MSTPPENALFLRENQVCPSVYELDKKYTMNYIITLLAKPNASWISMIEEMPLPYLFVL